DKSVFPRDKICGDALSGKVADVLQKIDSSIHTEFAAISEKILPCNGIVFSAPNGVAIEVPFRNNLSDLKYPAGYVAKRFAFDDFLFNKIDKNFADVIEGAEIKNISRVEDAIEIHYTSVGENKTLRCKLLIGAEGDRSLTARSLGGYKVNQKNYSAAVRAYYKGVNGMHQQNFIELHFLKGILPGYFWIFPLPNGEANVGVGIPSHIVSKKKTNLKNEMHRIIREHPVFKERFCDAEMIGEIKGWGLALGSEKRKISGDNFLLTGDAASLIDPFTGEGIGNAMLSGMKAAEQSKRCLDANRFDGEFLKQYDEGVYRVLWDELSLSTRLQKISRYPWLLNFLLNKATKNKVLRESIPFMFDNLDIRAKLKNPRFYLRLLFKYN
ncbi:MAG TPA: geranylgeranyl reductase family protein, partial [Bacteroidia bacterium]|nr:geranylgeranyl reductase family protein [Bacteroidia bacterium]